MKIIGKTEYCGRYDVWRQIGRKGEMGKYINFRPKRRTFSNNIRTDLIVLKRRLHKQVSEQTPVMDVS
jgi:hypothetical protein